MQITELRIRKVEGEGKLRAYVTVTFDDCFVVHNVKIIEDAAKKITPEDVVILYKDVAHPISPDFRNSLQDKILEEYNAGHIEEGPADGND